MRRYGDTIDICSEGMCEHSLPVRKTLPYTVAEMECKKRAGLTCIQGTARYAFGKNCGLLRCHQDE